MLKLGLLVIMLAAATGAVVLAPIHGRTVLARWETASGPADFLERGWAEAKASFAGTGSGRPSRQRTAHAGKPAARAAPAARPTERHTEADRAALDRIIAEHAR